MARSNAVSVTSTGGPLAAAPLMDTPAVEPSLAGEKAPWAMDPLSPLSLDLLRQFFALLDQWDRRQMTQGDGPAIKRDQAGDSDHDLAATLHTERPVVIITDSP